MANDRPKGVINLQGKDFPTWPFVLDKAHGMGLIGIETELIETPTEANAHSYIVRAKASFRPEKDGDPVRVFTGLGDAGPKNVNPKIVGATLRMAETRAMGRALRTATNIGETMYEELPGDDQAEERPSRYGAQADQAITDAAAPGRERMAAGPQTGADRAREAVAAAERPLTVEQPAGSAPACVECGVLLTVGQAKVSQARFKLDLCPTHQAEAKKALGPEVAA